MDLPNLVLLYGLRKNTGIKTMAHTLASNEQQFSGDNEIWYNLKSAIAASSGFQRWLHDGDHQLQKMPLEQQVQLYLRETLEALAY